MTVPTPHVACPIAPTPLATCHTAPSEVSHPHGVLRRGQANGTSASSSMPLPSHFYVASHVAHPHVTPYPVPSSASSTPPPTLSTSRFSVGISSAAVSSPQRVASHVSYPHIALSPRQANGTSNSSSTPLPSRSTSPSYVPTAPSSCFHNASHEPQPRIAPRSVQSRAPLTPLSPPNSHSTAHITSPHPLPPRRKRSRRCFVCGRTGKHRLNPRFCPRTYELLSKNLVKFDANFRLVSDDGSPLPMTRHPGGVAAHLLSPRRLPPRTICVAPRSVSKSPGTSQSNPPHVHRAPHTTPTPVHHRLPSTVPIADKTPLHALPAIVEHPRRISSPDRRFELNPPHLTREERSSSPPFRILTPFHESLPRPETPSKSTRYPDNVFILLLLDCLTLSPSWRRELAGLIDAINRLNLDDDIPTLQKLMEPVRECYKTFVPSI